MEELLKYTKAMVALQLQLLADSTERTKPELLLANAGFSHKEAAELLGKNAKAVQKTVERARKALA
jgi:DNA-directed RNA polymerase specialized sigma24 family protein